MYTQRRQQTIAIYTQKVYNYNIFTMLKEDNEKMKKKVALLLALILVFSMFAAGCGGGDDEAEYAGTVKIGVFEPASGDNGPGGKPYPGTAGHWPGGAGSGHPAPADRGVLRFSVSASDGLRHYAGSPTSCFLPLQK